jgi:very-short-patch-repair endonuclease
MARTSISRETRQKAHGHRRYLSKAERILWQRLRELRSEGMHFRRQAPVGPYIVDFAWLGARLVVELDGDNHETDQQKRHDATRDEFLKLRGFNVLRFSNWDAIDTPEWLIAKVREAVASYVAQPHPAAALPQPPSPQGGGLQTAEAVRARLKTPPHKGEGEAAAALPQPPSPQGGGPRTVEAASQEHP